MGRNPFVLVLIYFISTFLGSEMGASSWLCSDADTGSTVPWLPPLCCPQPTLRFSSGRIMSKSPSPAAVQWEKEDALPGAGIVNTANVAFLELLTRSCHLWGGGPPQLCLVTQTLLSIIHFLSPGQELVQPRVDQPVQTPWDSFRPSANSGVTFLRTTSCPLFMAFIPHTTPTGGFLFITCLLKKQGLQVYNPSTGLPVSE